VIALFSLNCWIVSLVNLNNLQPQLTVWPNEFKSLHLGPSLKGCGFKSPQLLQYLSVVSMVFIFRGFKSPQLLVFEFCKHNFYILNDAIILCVFKSLVS
jgi:hypothetical protein